MKKYTIITIIILSTGLIGLALNGCSSAVSPEPSEQNISEAALPEDLKESVPETALSKDSDKNAAETESSKGVDAVQGGPYGRLSISLPDGWSYKTYPVDSEELLYGLYGIYFYPEDAANGFIALTYMDNFGVCGTGLHEETAVVASIPVNIGTYDNNKFWDFISFREEYAGVVALTYSVDDWWESYEHQIWDILDTISFDPNVKEGGAYIYNAASEIEKIGLYFSLKHISPTGARLVFRQYDADAPTGELQCGEDFLIEVQNNGTWEEAPVIVEGNYGFNSIAYRIAAKDTSEQELDWQWLYGTLAPGNYRIKKSIDDFRASGDYDQYTVYAYFILN